jgi:hypothetical protein
MVKRDSTLNRGEATKKKYKEVSETKMMRQTKSPYFE